ncbi:MAG: response regulator [Lachnospiraceae bacterium]|nr:response regulator [Lachnospiraceae bacterium]
MIDILVMDTKLEDANGIQVVKELQERNSELQVIYLTGHVDYAKDIFEMNPACFLRCHQSYLVNMHRN